MTLFSTVQVMYKFRFSLLIIPLILTPSIPANTAEVKQLSDNTLKIENERYALYGIFVPKPTQNCIVDGKSWPCGAAATLRLEKLIKTNSLKCTAVLKHADISLAHCNLGDADLARLLVEDGWALSIDADSEYTSAEQQARENQLGIWRDGFLPPDEWRKYPDTTMNPYLDLLCSVCATRKQ